MFTDADRAAIIALVAPLLERVSASTVGQASLGTPTTTWRPGTCVSVDATGAAVVLVDGDTLPITVGVIGSLPAVSGRVMVVFVPPAAVFCFAMFVGATEVATPVFKFGSTALTPAVLDASYAKIGSFVSAQIHVKHGTIAGTGGMTFTAGGLPTPTAPAAGIVQTYMHVVGMMSTITVPGGAVSVGVVHWDGTQFYGRTTTSTYPGYSDTVTHTWATGDEWHINLGYLTAA